MHIDRGFLLHAGEWTWGILRGIALHIGTQPFHSRAVGAVFLDDTAIAVGCPSMMADISPKGDTRTVVSLPHVGYLLLVTLQLKVVVVSADVVLRAVHGHLQRILKFHHRILEFGLAAIGQVVALTAVGIDRCSGIAQRTHQVDKLVGVPLEGVEVIVNQDGVRPAFTGQFKGLDKPVVARLARTAKRLDEVGGVLLMPGDGLVHHINQGQIRIALLYLIHPFHDGIIAGSQRQVPDPAGILSTPHQCMELEGEMVVFGVIVYVVDAAPVPTVLAATLHRVPFALILRGNLVPQLVESLRTPVYLTGGGDVAQEFVRI